MLANWVCCVGGQALGERARIVPRTPRYADSSAADGEEALHLFQRCVGPKSKGYSMPVTSQAILLLVWCSCAFLAVINVSEGTGIDPPPTLAPGQAPPLTKQGPLAEPRSSDQVGFPTVLTNYA